jgi:alkylation response protein AidB-like acyl-CoA dehydrogenase
MLFDWTEEQLMLQNMLRKFTKNEVAPRDKWMDENGFDWDLHQKMVDAGIYAIPIPAEYGGAGFDFLTGIMVIHEVAKGSASAALNLDCFWLVYDILMRYGTPEQKAKYLPMAREGKRIGFALTESTAGSDATAIRATAAPAEGGGWILTGEKAWITNMEADYSIIFAKTDPTLVAKGISAFLVPKDSEGFHVGSHEDKMGLRGTTTGDLSFDHVYLPPESLLGKEGQGFQIAMSALDGARISISAVSTGLAHHAMELAGIYANERIAFKQPISAFEGIQFKFADMSSRIRAMELMIYDAARMKDQGIRNSLEAAQTKLLCSTWATQIALEAMQIMGANGCSREYHVERFVRDAKMIEVAEGTTEILKISIGRSVLAPKK